MGSEGFQQSDPKLCKNGCGFFGKAATMDLCSKCYRDLRVTEEQAVSDKAAIEKLVLSDKATMEKLAMVKNRVASSPPSLTGSVAAFGHLAEGVEVPASKAAARRCWSCNKKVGLVGFRCRPCGVTFCGTHRYPEVHGCKFDFKAAGKHTIARDNPVVKADKVVRF